MLVFAFDPDKYRSPQRVWDSERKQFLDRWVTTASFTVYLTDGRTIVVPVGFEYDKGSVPRFAWPLMPRDDRSGVLAWLVHDYLYATHETTRQEADQIMYELLRAGGMGRIRASAAYRAVRLGGWSAWNNNRMDAPI